MQWNKIETNKYGHVEKAGKLPAEKKEILLQMKSMENGVPDAVMVGYLKYAAGDKNSPVFIVPGRGGQVLAWCDCLIGKFVWPYSI
jgi:hypothetical protein